MSSKTCHLLANPRSFEGEKGAYHAGHTPYVGTSTPFGTEDNLRRPVLSSLYVIGKVMIYPTCVPQICNFDRDNFKPGNDIKFRSGLAQRYSGDLPGDDITTKPQSEKGSSKSASTIIPRCLQGLGGLTLSSPGPCTTDHPSPFRH